MRFPTSFVLDDDSRKPPESPRARREFPGIRYESASLVPKIGGPRRLVGAAAQTARTSPPKPVPATSSASPVATRTPEQFCRQQILKQITADRDVVVRPKRLGPGDLHFFGGLDSKLACEVFEHKRIHNPGRYRTNVELRASPTKEDVYAGNVTHEFFNACEAERQREVVLSAILTEHRLAREHGLQPLYEEKNFFIPAADADDALKLPRFKKTAVADALKLEHVVSAERWGQRWRAQDLAQLDHEAVDGRLEPGQVTQASSSIRSYYPSSSDSASAQARGGGYREEEVLAEAFDARARYFLLKQAADKAFILDDSRLTHDGETLLGEEGWPVTVDDASVWNEDGAPVYASAREAELIAVLRKDVRDLSSGGKAVEAGVGVEIVSPTRNALARLEKEFLDGNEPEGGDEDARINEAGFRALVAGSESSEPATGAGPGGMFRENASPHKMRSLEELEEVAFRGVPSMGRYWSKMNHIKYESGKQPFKRRWAVLGDRRFNDEAQRIVDGPPRVTKVQITKNPPDEIEPEVWDAKKLSTVYSEVCI